MRCCRIFFSASRARRASSSITSRGRPGARPVQVSGIRSTNSRSPAAMEFTVTLRASAKRTRLAVRIAARRANVAASARIDAVDRHVDRALESDGEDVVGDADLRLDFLGRDEDQPGEAVLDDRAHFALDGSAASAGGVARANAISKRHSPRQAASGGSPHEPPHPPELRTHTHYIHSQHGRAAASADTGPSLAD